MCIRDSTCHVSQLDAFYDIADGVDAGSAGLSVDVGFDEASLHGDTQIMSCLLYTSISTAMIHLHFDHFTV